MTNDNQHIPQGYKPSPLGPIPEDWEVKRLGDFSRCFSGGTPKSGNPLFYNGDIPFIRSGEINKDKTELFLSQEGVENSSAKFVEKGDILYALYGANSGQCSLSKIQGVINQAILCIRPDASKYYVMSVLQLNKEHYYNSFLQGGQGNLSGEIVSNYRLAIPPTEEQERICKVLQLWDTAIAKQTALIEQLTLRKHGLMQQLLTGKKRLKGFEGEWKEVRLGEMLHTLSNGMIYDTTTTDGFKITRIETISDGTININKVGYCEFEPANEFKLQKGDILYSHINSLSHIGKVAYYNLDETIYHGMNLLLLRTNELINNKYLYYLLLSSVSKHQALRYAKPAINQASISTSDIKKFKYKIPHIDEQNAIISVLVNADKEIEIQKQKLAAMLEQKKGLMQVLLTGKKRIKKIGGIIYVRS